jgi:hypothetical protein
MQRWILIRAASEPVVQRPKGKGIITPTPVWIDSLEGPDYYAKLVRKGIVEVLGEADARPAPTPPPPEPPAAPPAPMKTTKSAPKSGRQED